MENDFPTFPDPHRPRDGSAEVRLGKAVRALREARGWSQQQLATQLTRRSAAAHRATSRERSYTQSMIAKTETATRPITLDEAVLLSIVFGNSLEVMLAVDEAPDLAAAIARNEALLTDLDAQITSLQQQRGEVYEELAYLRSAAQVAAQSTRQIDDLAEHQRLVAAWEEAKNPGSDFEEGSG